MAYVMLIAGCLGVATNGPPLFYEDAAERNTPARWKSVLQDRVFLRPAAEGTKFRDFCAVLRMGKKGAARVAEGPVRVGTTGEGVRVYCLRDGRGQVITLVANFGRTETTAEVEGLGAVRVPAMDVEVCSANPGRTS